MTEPDVNAGLRNLRQSLAQMKALLAWEQLKQSEARPSEPPVFQVYDPTETDLRNEYSFFLSTSIQIHTILNERYACIPAPAREAVRRTLAKLEQQVYQLNLHQMDWRY
jgi:hypothetical protein